MRGVVPNYGLNFTHNLRLGPFVTIPALKGNKNRFKTLKETSLYIEGARIFNSLPKDLRLYQGTQDNFKKYLDMYLETLPDQPNRYKDLIPSTVDHNCKSSNTIRDWSKKLQTSGWTMVELAKENDRRNEDGGVPSQPINWHIN